MRLYTLKVRIEEGCDKFWSSFEGTGCDAVVAEVKSCLSDHGFNEKTGCYVSLEKFEDFE